MIWSRGESRSVGEGGQKVEKKKGRKGERDDASGWKERDDYASEEGNEKGGKDSLMHFASTSPSFPVPVSRSPVPKLAPMKRRGDGKKD